MQLGLIQFTGLKIAINSKRTSCRVKQSEIGESETQVKHKRVYLALQHLRSFRGSWWTCLKLAVISNMAGRRVKLTKILESGIVVKNIERSFDLIAFNASMGSFSTFVSKWPLSRKRKFCSDISQHISCCLDLYNKRLRSFCA